MTNFSNKKGTKRVIKILFLIDELNVGGTENQLVWLCENLPRDRFAPTLGVLRQTAYQESLALDTPVVSFNWHGLTVIKNFQLIGRLRRYLALENFDILQTQFIESEIYGSLAAFLLAKKPMIISTRRNLYHWIANDPWRFRICRYLASNVDHILVNSFATQEKCHKLEAVSKDKITVIQNAVDIKKFNGDKSTASKKLFGFDAGWVVVGVVGNWRPVKGNTSFLQAAALIRQKVENAMFVLVGNGPQEQKLVEMAKDLNLIKNTIFFRNVQDVTTIIRAFDIAVQPSFSESFSNVLLEYMAAARPIVATNVGDAGEMIRHGCNGLLVNPGDPAAMAKAVIQLCENRQLGEGMGAEAAADAEAFWSADSILQKYSSFYSNVKRLNGFSGDVP